MIIINNNKSKKLYPYDTIVPNKPVNVNLDKLNYELLTDKIAKKVKDKLKDLDMYAPLKDLSLEDKKLLIKAINEELEEFNMEVYIFEDKLFIINVPNHQYIRYTIK